jgi:hypothetical protein
VALTKGVLLLRRQRQEVGPGERARRRDADGTDGVTKQRCCCSKPALAALPFRTAVPGDAERLIPAAGKGDPVLLQRIDPEGVSNLVVVKSPVGALGTDHELVA